MLVLFLIGLGYAWEAFLVLARTVVQLAGGIAAFYLAFQAGGLVSALLVLLGTVVLAATVYPFVEMISEPRSHTARWMAPLNTWVSSIVLLFGVFFWLTADTTRLLSRGGFTAALLAAAALGFIIAIFAQVWLNRGYKSPPMMTHAPLD